MRIQKAARRKIIHRWKLHGTTVSCNLACLKQWYLVILQWMKLKMFWAVPSFGNIQYSLSVHSADYLEDACPLAEFFCQKTFETGLSACVLGREKDLCIRLYETVWDQGLIAAHGRRKSGNEGQYHGHILVRLGAGLWLLLSPIITPVQPAQLLRGLRRDRGQ